MSLLENVQRHLIRLKAATLVNGKATFLPTWHDFSEGYEVEKNYTRMTLSA